MNKTVGENKQNSEGFKSHFQIAGMIAILHTISACENGKVTHEVCSKRVKNIIECMVIVTGSEDVRLCYDRLMTVTNNLEGAK